MTMRLPTPIYKALPVAYMVIGMLLITGSFYLGIATTGIAGFYLALGVFCIASGIYVRRLRSKWRGEARGAGKRSGAEQT